MSDAVNAKPIPRSILIFGAAGHIGAPLAEFLHREAPQIQLRLVSSRPDGVDGLRRAYPHAEVVHANYDDLPSLQAAADGIEGVWVNTPAGTEERPAMANVVTALEKAGTAVHVLRLLGMQPEANPRRVPASLRDSLLLPMEHPVAKRVLDDSDLPVTYLNIGATMMDNIFNMAPGLRAERRLVWHNRLIPFIDPREIGEVAGRLFLSDNHRHIGQFHTLNNGHDLMRFSDVAELMSDVFGEPITYDGSKEAFSAAYGPHMGPAHESLWEFFEYEKANEVVWAPNDFVERTLGRKPRTAREWLTEHATVLLGR